MYGEVLKKLRLNLGLNTRDFGKKVGLSYSYVAQLEKERSYQGKERLEPRIAVFEKICKALDYPFDKFLQEAGYTDNTRVEHQLPQGFWVPNFTNVPLYENICCGDGCRVEDNIIGSVPVADLPGGGEYIANRAQGDSMINAGIDDGDIIVIRKQPTLDNGEIGAFCLEDNMAVIRRFHRDEATKTIILTAENPKNKPMIIGKNDEFRIVGKIYACIKKF